MVGRLALLTPTMALIEIIEWAPLLDMAIAERLDMEGGRTGRVGHFRPSDLQRIEI